MGNRGFAWVLVDFPSNHEKQAFIDAFSDAQDRYESLNKDLLEQERQEEASGKVTLQRWLNPDRAPKKLPRTDVMHPALYLILDIIESYHPMVHFFTTTDEVEQFPYVIIGNEWHPLAAASSPNILCKIAPKQRRSEFQDRIIDRVVLFRSEVNWRFSRYILDGLADGVKIVIMEGVEMTDPFIHFYWGNVPLDEWIKSDKNQYVITPINEDPLDEYSDYKHIAYINWTGSLTIPDALPPITGDIDPEKHYLDPHEDSIPFKYELDPDVLTLLDKPQ